MLLKLINVSIELGDYPSQLRSYKKPNSNKRRAGSTKANGQRLPAMGWTVKD